MSDGETTWRSGAQTGMSSAEIAERALALVDEATTVAIIADRATSGPVEVELPRLLDALDRLQRFAGLLSEAVAAALPAHAPATPAG